MLIEREDELARLATAAGEASACRGGLLLVEGPAGIGKSALLNAAAHLVTDMRVMRACGAELERPLGFGVVRQLFEPVLADDPAAIERLLTGAAANARIVLSESPEDTSEAVTYHPALTWLTANLANVRPLILLIDDLHWSDAASLGWLEHLARRVATLPVLVVAAWRTTEPDSDEDALDRIRDEPRCMILRPAPLSLGGVERIVRAAMPAADPAIYDACNRSTGGNPFLLAEVVRTLHAHSGAGGINVSDVRPESVQRSVQRRLKRLGPEVVGVAEACAVLGDLAEPRHVAALSGLLPPAAASALDRLVDAHILDPRSCATFVHPLVRLAVYDKIGAQARALAHLTAARLLDAEGFDAERVALHLMLAPVQADHWTAHTLLSAANAALARGAPIEARTILLRALDEHIDALRPNILLALANAEFRAAHPDFAQHARELYADAAMDPIIRAHALVMSQSFAAPLPGSDPTADLDIAESVLARLDLEDPPAADAGSALRSIINVARSLSAPRDIASVREMLVDHPVRTRGLRSMLTTLVYEAAVSGHVSADECLPHLHRAMVSGDARNDVLENVADVQGLLVLVAADDLETLDLLVNRGLARGRSENMSQMLSMYLGLNCAVGWARGDLLAAEADGRAALTAEGMLEAITMSVAFPLARVLIDRGQIDAADDLVEQSTPDGSAILGRAGVVMATALVRAAQGNWEEAADLACSIGRTYPYAAGAHLHGIPWRCVAAEAFARLGQTDRARDLLDEQRPLTRTWGTRRQQATLLRAEAQVVDLTRGTILCRQATELLGPTQLRGEQARTRLLLGMLLRRANQRTEARTELARALDLAAACNADGLAAAATEELKATGARPRRQRLYGADALTASEERVARLAADGASNPQIARTLFVARKTVETQLSTAYRKLGITGRAELREALAPE